MALEPHELLAFFGRDVDGTVVWLRGEHDLSTVTRVSETIAEAVALDETGLVIDLSGVRFMDAGTVSIILRTRDFLAQRSRTLRLRAPSPTARRMLELCDPGLFVDRAAAGAGALGSWVAVPAELSDAGLARPADDELVPVTE